MRNKEDFQALRGKVAAILQKSGVAEAVFEYAGSGDDGGIEHQHFVAKGGEARELSNEDERVLVDFAYDAIDMVVGGYENNDGGGGTLQVALVEDGGDAPIIKIGISHSSNHTEEYETFTQSRDCPEICDVLRKDGITSVEVGYYDGNVSDIYCLKGSQMVDAAHGDMLESFAVAWIEEAGEPDENGRATVEIIVSEDLATLTVYEQSMESEDCVFEDEDFNE